MLWLSFCLVHKGNILQAIQTGKPKASSHLLLPCHSDVPGIKNGTPRNAVFYKYYQKRLKDGKSKTQVLICIARRLVNIVYGMLKNKLNTECPMIPMKVKQADKHLQESKGAENGRKT